MCIFYDKYNNRIQHLVIGNANRIGGVTVMVSVLECRSRKTKDYKIGFCCFSAKHVALRRKIKDWLARNQNNMTERSDISTRGMLFQ